MMMNVMKLKARKNLALLINLKKFNRILKLKKIILKKMSLNVILTHKKKSAKHTKNLFK